MGFNLSFSPTNILSSLQIFFFLLISFETWLTESNLCATGTVGGQRDRNEEADSVVQYHLIGKHWRMGVSCNYPENWQTMNPLLPQPPYPLPHSSLASPLQLLYHLPTTASFPPHNCLISFPTTALPPSPATSASSPPTQFNLGFSLAVVL